MPFPVGALAITSLSPPECLPRPDIHHLMGFFDVLQGSSDGVYGVPPEGPNDRPLPNVIDSLEDRRQDQGAPASPDTPPWPYSPAASDGGASNSPGVSDSENVAPPTRSPPKPNRGF